MTLRTSPLFVLSLGFLIATTQAQTWVNDWSVSGDDLIGSVDGLEVRLSVTGEFISEWESIYPANTPLSFFGFSEAGVFDPFGNTNNFNPATGNYELETYTVHAPTGYAISEARFALALNVNGAHNFTFPGLSLSLDEGSNPPPTIIGGNFIEATPGEIGLFTVNGVDGLSSFSFTSVHGIEEDAIGLAISFAPIPEPSTSLALAAGLLVLSTRRSRR